MRDDLSPRWSKRLFSKHVQRQNLNSLILHFAIHHWYHSRIQSRIMDSYPKRTNLLHYITHHEIR